MPDTNYMTPTTKNKLKYFILILGLISLPLRAFPAPDGLKERLAMADAAFMERADSKRALEALALYREFHREDPGDPAISWRLSMACYHAGFELAKGNKEKKKMYAEGRDAGLAALARDPGSAEAHFWTAINMALYGQTVGVLKMLFTVNAVRSHLRATIERDPAYAYGGAYRVMGKIDESVPGIFGGSLKEARKNYEKAIALGPDEASNYFFLAKLYADRFHDPKTALEIAREGLALPPPAPFRMESLGALRELRTFVQQYAEKAEVQKK